MPKLVMTPQRQVILMTGAQKRFDGNLTNHYHLHCIRCGRLEDAPVEPIASIEACLEGKSDYEILGHHLEFVGLCPRCTGVGLRYTQNQR